MRNRVRSTLLLLVGLVSTMAVPVQAAPPPLPVANAGPDQSTVTGAVVSLDGSGSYSPRGERLSFAWTFSSKPAGSTAVLSSSTAVKPTFTADKAGLYEVGLVVKGKKLSSLPDSVTITAYPQSTGVLDGTFGNRGMANGGPIGRGRAVVILPDGKFLVTGENPGDFLLARFNANGSLDTTFGINGLASYDSGRADTSLSVAVQADGKALVAGYSYSQYAGYDNDVMLVRFNTDGSLDDSFGSNGVVVYDSGAIEFVSAVAVQADGKPLVAGYTVGLSGSTNDIMLVRFNADGTLDTTFGTNGLAMGDGGYDEQGSSVVLQPDGKALVAGYGNSGAVLARFNTDGTLDTTFGSSGMASFAGAYGASATSVALQADGKAVVAGSGSNGTDYDFLVVRFNADGTLDTTFGTNGATYVPYGTSDGAASVALQPDNKALVTGTSYSGTDYNLVLMKFNADGTLDSAFGSGGTVSIDYGYYEYGFDVALQPDGKVLVVGQSFYYGLLLARWQ